MSRLFKSKFFTRSLIVVFVLFLLIQVYPYGRDHTNPPVKNEPVWSGPQTRELFTRACGDCHSNQTEWPWYSHVAPASWLIQNHVDEGRAHFNVSEWGREGKNEGEEAAEAVEKGYMPIKNYTWLHPSARLSDEEKKTLIKGLKATFNEEDEGEEREEITPARTPGSGG